MNDGDTQLAVNFLRNVMAEVKRAQTLHAPLNSAHEAYAVLLEEVEEFWDEVRKRKAERNPKDIVNELTQIAAMACRTAVDLYRDDIP